MSATPLVEATKATLIDCVDTIGDWADTATAIATDDAFIDQIPIISTGIKILKARDAFREQLFIRNCRALLNACKTADREHRERLWEKLSGSSAQVDDFVDTLFLIAVDSSKPIKATIVGRLFAALCNEQITYGQYDRLVHIVHSSSVAALQALPEFFARTNGAAHISAHTVTEEPLLLSCGIAHRFGNAFRISDLGQVLYRFGFDGAINNEIRTSV